MPLGFGKEEKGFPPSNIHITDSSDLEEISKVTEIIMYRGFLTVT